MTQFGERFVHEEFYKQMKRLHLPHQNALHNCFSMLKSCTMERQNRMQLLLLKCITRVLGGRQRIQPSIWAMSWSERDLSSFSSNIEWNFSLRQCFPRCQAQRFTPKYGPSALLYAFCGLLGSHRAEIQEWCAFSSTFWDPVYRCVGFLHRLEWRVSCSLVAQSCGKIYSEVLQRSSPKLHITIRDGRTRSSVCCCWSGWLFLCWACKTQSLQKLIWREGSARG